MEAKIFLTEPQRAQLLLLIGKEPSLKKLAEWYKVHKGDYDAWAQEFFDNPVKFGGKIKYYRGESLVLALKQKIMAWDGDLQTMVNAPQAKNLLQVSFDTVCDLFARNSWAENPVQPGQKHE